MNNEELKPCPFCGGAARHLPRQEGFYDEAAICDVCGVDMEPAAWNRRAAPPAAAPGASIGQCSEFEGAVKSLHYNWTPNGVHKLIDLVDAKLAQRFEAGRSHMAGLVNAELAAHPASDICAAHFKRNASGEWHEVPREHSDGAVILYHAKGWPDATIEAPEPAMTDKPKGCTGTPECCPDNEGHGCHCSQQKEGA